MTKTNGISYSGKMKTETRVRVSKRKGIMEKAGVKMN